MSLCDLNVSLDLQQKGTASQQWEAVLIFFAA